MVDNSQASKESKNLNEQADPDLESLKRVIQARKSFLFDQAKDILQEILKRKPLWEPARRELIQLYLAAENYADAEIFIKKEITRLPHEPIFWLNLANIYNKTGKPTDEIQALKKFIDFKYDENLTKKLFDLQKNTNDLSGALETIETLKKHTEDTFILDLAKAKLLNITEKFDESLKLAEELLNNHLTSSDLIELWTGIILQHKNDPQRILDKFQPHVKDKNVSRSILVSISRAYQRLERPKEAMELLKQAIAESGEHIQASWWYDLSLLQRQSGLNDESQESLLASLKLNSNNPTALRVFGVEYKAKYGDEFIKYLNYDHAQIDSYPDNKKVELHFALAKAYEDLDELPTAFKHYEVAGKIQSKILPYRHTGAISVLRNMRRGVHRKLYEDFKHERTQANKSVFILGMPRSGTSLSEQILSSHPDVFGAGELKLLHRIVDGISINKKPLQTDNGGGAVQTYIPGVDLKDTKKLTFLERGELYVKGIESLAEQAGKPDATRIIDKMPGNYFWTGIIPLILPQAKIIHTQRHPIDNCLSLYRIYFPDGMPWSYNLVNLAKAYKACYEHMKHWETSLPEGMMITMNYEVMVADFENQARKLIDHVGLDWNDACLRFYETERTVKTASLSQVRKPIYNTSVGRWKKYEPYLKPLIRELGPLVEEYEAKIASKLKEIK